MTTCCQSLQSYVLRDMRKAIYTRVKNNHCASRHWTILYIKESHIDMAFAWSRPSQES